MARGWWQALGRWGQCAVTFWALACVVIGIRVMLSKPRP